MSIVIQALSKNDIPACATLTMMNELFCEYGLNEEKVKGILKLALANDAADLIVAKDNDQVLGYAWLEKKGGFARSGYLRLIAVHPKSQGHGVGAKLMAFLEERYLKSNGMFLLVTKTNNNARKFYESLGYKKLGEIPDFVVAGLIECIYYRTKQVRRDNAK